MPTEIEVRDLRELLDAVKAAQAAFKIAVPGDVWYRGQACADWLLRPSVHRDLTSDHEATMIQKFQTRARSRHPVCPQTADYVAWFCLMQHYGLPTRLLDWSESVLTAAFFAVNDEEARGPAVIWALSPGHLNQSQGLEPGMYNLGSPQAFELLEAAVLAMPHADKVIAVIAPETDPRMMMQQAAFTLHGSVKPLEQFDGSHQFLVKIRVPEKSKPTVRAELAAFGIRLSSVFPDLTNLALEIKGTHKRIVERQKGPTP